MRAGMESQSEIATVVGEVVGGSLEGILMDMEETTMVVEMGTIALATGEREVNDISSVHVARHKGDNDAVTTASQTSVCLEDFDHIKTEKCPLCGKEHGNVGCCALSWKQQLDCGECSTYSSAVSRWFRCQLSEACVVAAIVPTGGAVTIANRLSGVLCSLGFLVVLNCWVVHSPTLTENIIVWTSIAAFFVLNTVEWATVMAVQTRSSVVILFAVCYSAMSVYLAWVVWGLVITPNATIPDDVSTQEEVYAFRQKQFLLCEEGCCLVFNGYHALSILGSASILRFSEPAVRYLYGASVDSYAYSTRYASLNRTTGGSMGGAKTIFLIILSTLFSVLAITLQLFSTISRFGSPQAFLVPLAYIVTLPMAFLSRARANMLQRAGVDAHVSMAWSQFFPAFTYIACIGWPIILHRNDMINLLQTWLSIVSSVLFIIASRCLQVVVEASAV